MQKEGNGDNEALAAEIPSIVIDEYVLLHIADRRQQNSSIPSLIPLERWLFWLCYSLTGKHDKLHHISDRKVISGECCK